MNESPQSTGRVIRVFISSTFRDMMRERDLLVKEVFPELRRKCSRRFVTFTEVDLRWGITEAQANEGQVLPLCLAEIERSRPYFIGLLGERYGWIPDTLRPEVIEREPWLKEHVQGRTSVTELEVLHGVLNNPKMQSHAYFYFRDPLYVNNPALTEDERRDMVERNIDADVAKYGEAEATRRTEERKVKLAALKQRIRDSKLPLAEPYPNPKILARLIRRQLNRLIDRLYPEGQVPDALVQERMAHEAHAMSKVFACIDRPVHLAALDDFARHTEHNGKGLVVTGESGGGKTALLAAWARRWAKQNPDDFLFQHYFGATSDSASPEGFLRRLLGELKRSFGIAGDIPADLDTLRDTLPLWLGQATGRDRVVLVLDGLNQVQGGEPDRRLRFLPQHFPPHVKVLASTLPGPALDALRERAWTEHNLPRASEAEVDMMVGEYFRVYGRHVDAEGRPLQTEVRRQLASASGSRNPLYLRTILEELRQVGNFERLPRRVSHYLEATNPKDLFLRVLKRWQEDFDGKDSQQDKRGLVGRALMHLWAARQGLSEPEWLDMLGNGSRPFPRALWTPLFLSLEPHLSQRAGLLTFGHDFLREAVQAAFLASEDSQRSAHLSVADYFEHHTHQREMTPRKAAEWPYQLHAAGVWDRLKACLADIPLFLALYREPTKWDLSAYWLSLRQRGCDPGAIYEAAYATYTSSAPTSRSSGHLANELGLFLYENDSPAAAEPLLRRAVHISADEGGLLDKQFLTSLNNVGLLLMSRGQNDEATSVLRRALAGRQRWLGPEHPHTLQSMDTLACLLIRRGDFVTAELLLQREQSASERVLGAEHPQTLTCLHNIAYFHTQRGNDAAAEPLFRHVAETSKRVLGREHPSVLNTCTQLASLLERKGEYTEAEALLRYVLGATERLSGPDSTATFASRTNLALLLTKKGEYAVAEQLCRTVLNGSERWLGSDHANTLSSLNNLAYVLEHKGDLAQAEHIYRRALNGRERLLGPDHRDTLISVNNLANLLQTIGKLADAEILQRRALETQGKILGPDHPLTLTSASNLAMLLERKGDLQGAEMYCRRALEGRTRVLGSNHPETLVCLDNLGSVKSAQGNLEEAEDLRRRALHGLETTLGPDDPHTITTIGNLAAILDERGKDAEAGPLYFRSFESRHRILGPDHPHTLVSLRGLSVFHITLNNRANELFFKGDYRSAEPLYQRAFAGAAATSRIRGVRQPDLNTFAGNYINCLIRLGRSETEIRQILDEVIRNA